MPLIITSTQPLSYKAETIPGKGLAAQPVKVSMSSTAGKNIQGDAEITVRGLWQLHIVANGPEGQGMVDMPLPVIAPPAIPEWLGWCIGIIPLLCLFAFLFLQRRKSTPQVEAPHPSESQALIH